jgi:hypothetical protein
MGTDKDAVLDPNAVEYRDVVLDLDTFADVNILADLDGLAQHTVGANPGSRLDMGKVPDLGSRPHLRAGINDCRGMDEDASRFDDGSISESASPKRIPAVLATADRTGRNR